MQVEVPVAMPIVREDVFLVVDLAVLLDVFLFPEKMVIRHLKAIFERVVSQSYHSFNFVFIVSYFNSIFNFNIIKKYEPNIYFES